MNDEEKAIIEEIGEVLEAPVVDELFHTEDCENKNLPIDPEDSCGCTGWTKLSNVFDQATSNVVDEATKNHHVTVLAQAKEDSTSEESEIVNIFDNFTVEDLKKTAEAFSTLSKEFMKAFLYLETACEAGAQLCRDMVEMLEVTNASKNLEGEESND